MQNPSSCDVVVAKHRHRIVRALFGSLLQSARFQHSVFDQGRYLKAINTTWEYIDSSSIGMVGKFDEDAFVWSLHRLIVAVRSAAKANNGFIELATIFDRIANDVKATRDMREHIDDYEAHHGRQQSDFVHTKNFADYGPISADASWQIIVGKEFFLGNRLNFWEAERALFSILATICRRADFLDAVPGLRQFSQRVDWDNFDQLLTFVGSND